MVETIKVPCFYGGLFINADYSSVIVISLSGGGLSGNRPVTTPLPFSIPAVTPGSESSLSQLAIRKFSKIYAAISTDCLFAGHTAVA